MMCEEKDVSKYWTKNLAQTAIEIMDEDVEVLIRFENGKWSVEFSLCDIDPCFEFHIDNSRKVYTEYYNFNFGGEGGGGDDESKDAHALATTAGYSIASGFEGGIRTVICILKCIRTRLQQRQNAITIQLFQELPIDVMS